MWVVQWPFYSEMLVELTIDGESPDWDIPPTSPLSFTIYVLCILILVFLFALKSDDHGLLIAMNNSDENPPMHLYKLWTLQIMLWRSIHPLDNRFTHQSPFHVPQIVTPILPLSSLAIIHTIQHLLIQFAGPFLYQTPLLSLPMLHLLEPRLIDLHESWSKRESNLHLKKLTSPTFQNGPRAGITINPILPRKIQMRTSTLQFHSPLI